MSLQLADSTAVVVARHFNPSIVNQLWMVENHLLTGQEFEPGCIFTDLFVQAKTRTFDLLVTTEQLQFRPKVDPSEQQALLADKVGRFVGVLPHTPYNAIGLNFVWQFVPERSDIRRLTRQLFFVPDGSVHQAFDVEDARFGGYFSKDIFGGRLRLDMKPAMGERDGTEVQHLLMAFNFHRDVSGADTVADIREMLNHWNDAHTLSSQIAESVAQKDLE